MKLVKKFSLGVILKLAAAVLGIVAFCMMFAEQIKVTSPYSSGSSNIAFADAVDGAGGIVVGYILVIVAALAFVVAGLFEFNKKMINLIVVGAAVLLAVVGAVLIFCVGAMYKAAVDANQAASIISGLTEASYGPAAGPVVGGILAIVGAAAGAVGHFLGAKK